VNARTLPTVTPGHPAARRVRAKLRELVDGERSLGRISMVTDWMLSGYEPMTDAVTLEVTHLPLTRERVVALKVVLDVELKLLGKVLPDLKAVEMTDSEGQPLPASGDRLVLATKLLAIMREREEEPEWMG